MSIKPGQPHYRIYLHYPWLPNPVIGIARVRERVKKGGHDVPASDVRRRFHRSLQHFVSDYAPLTERWAVWNNHANPPALLAESSTCSLATLGRILLPP